ncbi:MAG: VWA domain-containing protein [Acidobacteriota bacterium]
MTRIAASSRRPLAALFFFCLTCPALLVAQADNPVFSEVIDVEVYNLEVVVTDKQGEPISGLTRDDFEVFEDGQPVELTNFYAVERMAPPTEDAAEVTDRPAGATRTLSLVVFVDNINIRPENRKLMFENLRSDLGQVMVPGTQVMLAAMNNRIEVMHPFTDDATKILAALDELERQTSIGALIDGERRNFMSRVARASTRGMRCNRTRPPGSGSGGGGGGGGGLGTDPTFDNAVREAQDLAQTVRTLGEQRYQAARGTIGSLAAFSDTLGGLPGRKALLYLSDGIPTRPAESLGEAWIAKYDQWFQQNENAIRNCSRYPEAVADLTRARTGSNTSSFNLESEFDRLTVRASDNRVAFYPISNSGRNAAMISAANTGSSDGGSSQVMRSAMIAESMSRDGSMLQMAEDTGGRALTGNANVGKLLDQANRDFTSFYSLGYTPPKRSKDDVSFHEIKVKVKREDVKTRHIKGYHAKTWRDRLADMTVASALYDLEANPLGIQLQTGDTERLGGRFKVPVLVQIPFNQIQMVSDGGKYSASLSILVVVRDNKGGFSKPRRFDLPIEIPNAQILNALQQMAAYPIELELKKGDRRVAVAVRDHIGQTASTLKLDFDFGGGGKKKKDRKSRKNRRAKG